LQAIVPFDLLHYPGPALVVLTVADGLAVLVDPHGNDVDVIVLCIRMSGYKVGRVLETYCLHVPLSGGVPLLVS
jgi:hypothetical protein